MSQQKYRAYGIIVADNELSPVNGPYVHRQVLVTGNKIGYADDETEPTVAGIGKPAGAAMMLAGIKQLHVTNNLIHVNAPHPMRVFRAGTVPFNHNTEWDGTVFPGWIGDTDGYYDEPETVIDDAFILSMFHR